MASNEINIVLDPDSKAFIEALFPEKLLRIKKPLEKIGVQHRKHIDETFRNPGSRDSDLAWKKLNPLTVKYKKKKFGVNRGILIGKGRLKRSLTKRNAEGNISVVGKERAEFGTSVPYAKFHFDGLPNRRITSQKQLNFLKFGVGMFGKKIGSKIPLPKRDMVSPNKRVRDRWLDIIDEGVKENFKFNRIEVNS